MPGAEKRPRAKAIGMSYGWFQSRMPKSYLFHSNKNYFLRFATGTIFSTAEGTGNILRPTSESLLTYTNIISLHLKKLWNLIYHIMRDVKCNFWLDSLALLCPSFLCWIQYLQSETGNKEPCFRNILINTTIGFRGSPEHHVTKRSCHC